MSNAFVIEARGETAGIVVLRRSALSLSEFVATVLNYRRQLLP